MKIKRAAVATALALTVGLGTAAPANAHMFTYCGTGSYYFLYKGALHKATYKKRYASLTQWIHEYSVRRTRDGYTFIDRHYC